MDGSPSRGETIPIRLFLGGFDLTPTFRDVNKKFSTRYYLSLVLIDEGLSAVLTRLVSCTRTEELTAGQTRGDTSSSRKSSSSGRRPNRSRRTPRTTASRRRLRPTKPRPKASLLNRRDDRAVDVWGICTIRAVTCGSPASCSRARFRGIGWYSACQGVSVSKSREIALFINTPLPKTC